MKIWILTNELPQPLCGGIARYTDEMAAALSAAGHDLTVIGAGSAAGGGVSAGGYRCHAVETREHAAGTGVVPGAGDEAPNWPFNSLNRDLAIAWELSEAVAALAAREGAPDVIEVPEYKALGVFLKQRQLTDPAFLPGVAIVVMLHTPDFIVRRYNQEPTHTLPDYWVAQQEKASILAADAVCAPSAFIAEEIRGRLESPDLVIDICPNPLAVSHVDESGEETTFDPEEVLFFGRLEARKGVLELLRAMEGAWRGGATTRLTLLGPSIRFPPRHQPMTTFIGRKYAHRLESGQLLIIPGMEHGQALARLRRAAVVVIPSLWENFPYACLEAMAAGQVVLASVHGGMREVIGDDEQAGFLFSWENPGQFIEQLEKVLALDAEQRRSVGQGARQRVRRLCDPGDVVAARLATYKRARRAAGERRLFPFPPSSIPGKPRLAERPEAAPEMPLISVVIPFYNLGEFLPEALHSVLESDYESLEVIILNDGSTEPESLAVLARIEAEKDPRVRVIHQENQGLSAARNAGAFAARGEWVAFVDADDAVEPSFLRRAAWVLARYANVHIVASWVRFFGADEGIWHAWNLEFPYLLAHNLIIPICLVRRDSFLAHGRNCGAMEYGLEDFESWISMLSAGCGGVAIPEPLARYRVRAESMFQSINRQQQMYLYQVTVDRHPELYQRYGDELFRLLFANGPAHDMDQPTMWSAPYDTLRERLLKPLAHERKKTEAQWRENLELQRELQAALKEAERQWLEGCSLRERLERLHAEHRELQQRLHDLEADRSSAAPSKYPVE